jgi:CRISPR-associated protein Csh1
MIKEITNFVETLPTENFSNNLQLKEGLYIFLDIEEGQNGEAILKNVDSDGNLNPEDFAIYGKNSEDSPFFKKCLEWSQYIEPVSSNKAFNRKFFVLTANPFCIAFKKEFFLKEDRHNKETFNKSLEEFFKNSKKYYEVNYGVQVNLFKKFLINNLWAILLDFEPFLEMSNKNVYIFSKNLDFTEFIKVYDNYLESNVFNKPEFTIIFEGENYMWPAVEMERCLKKRPLKQMLRIFLKPFTDILKTFKDVF